METAGIDIVVEDGIEEQGSRDRSSVQNFDEAEKIVDGIGIDQKMEQQLGRTSVGRIVDAVDRTDQPYVD